MIGLSFNINSPWRTRFRSLRSRIISLSEKWVAELQLVQDDILIGFTLNITASGDHRGVFMDLSFVRYTMIVQIYNTEHED